jgi:hypothetical protein
MREETKPGNWVRFVLLLPVAWVLIFGFYISPWIGPFPRSKSQWLLLVLLGPPAGVLIEALFGWLFSTQNGYAISRRGFSMARVLIQLSIMLACSGLLYALLWALKLT